MDLRLDPLFDRDNNGGRLFVAPRPANKLFNNDGDRAQINAWNDDTVKTPNLFSMFLVGRDTCVSNDCCLLTTHVTTTCVCVYMQDDKKQEKKQRKFITISDTYIRDSYKCMLYVYYFRIYVVFFSSFFSLKILFLFI